tara:strand:- start:132 stop:329 length:198 start_codon:yes stop_codon:yes gene_type:complete
MSQLKKLVNDKPLWDSFCAELNVRLDRVHTTMEQSDSAETLFRLQGQAAALRSLKALRAEVNADG